MGTTTNYAIPYPEPTDFVTDGAQAMENIAEKVDAQMFAGVANRNLLYNGAMQVAQRNTNVPNVTATGYYTADRWRHSLSSFGTWTDTIENDAPTGSGFRKSLKVLCTTADATPASGDFHIVEQLLEGQDLQAIRKGTSSAQQLTVSFWVKANISGTYIIELQDADNSRQCSKSYVINATNTWEYKTVTFPADTTGVFDNDSSGSLTAAFWLGAGSGYTSGTLNTSWATIVNANRAVGQTNVGATINNYWQITGVQMTIGATDSPFQFKSYQQELRECMRYFQTFVDPPLRGTVDGTTRPVRIGMLLPVQMRVAPTMPPTTSGTLSFFDGGTIGNFVSFLVTYARSTSVEFDLNLTAGFTQGRASVLYIGGGGSMSWSAEL